MADPGTEDPRDPTTGPTIMAWLSEVAAELDLTEATPSHADIRLLLDLARDAAHHVERPAAPLTTFLVGVAVGRGASVPEASARASALALARGGEQD